VISWKRDREMFKSVLSICTRAGYSSGVRDHARPSLTGPQVRQRAVKDVILVGLHFIEEEIGLVRAAMLCPVESLFTL
jgi:hypothetical protein